MDGPLLVTYQNVPESILFGKGIIDVNDGTARITENSINAFRLNHLDQNLGTIQFHDFSYGISLNTAPLPAELTIRLYRAIYPVLILGSGFFHPENRVRIASSETSNSMVLAGMSIRI